MNAATLLSYAAPVAGLLCAQVGSGIALGFATKYTTASLARQPSGQSGTMRLNTLGMVMIESGIIITLVIAIMALTTAPALTLGAALVRLGCCLGVGLAAGVVSICSSQVVQASLEALGRQPLMDQKIGTLMLIAQSLLEAPVMFAMVITFMMHAHWQQPLELVDGIRYGCAGLLLGLACIGPAIGQMLISKQAIQSASNFPDSFNTVWTFAILLLALVETPVVFCMVLIMLALYHPSTASSYVQTTTLATGGLTLACASFGAGIGMGYLGKTSCLVVCQNPEQSGLLARVTLLASAFIESLVIYALIIALTMVVQ